MMLHVLTWYHSLTPSSEYMLLFEQLDYSSPRDAFFRKPWGSKKKTCLLLLSRSLPIEASKHEIVAVASSIVKKC